MSRQQMEAVIRAGGAVLYRGRSIARVQDLPTEAELAQGDPQAEQRAAESLRAQMAELQRQLAQLQAGQAAVADESQPAEGAGGQEPPATGTGKKKSKPAEGEQGGEG